MKFLLSPRPIPVSEKFLPMKRRPLYDEAQRARRQVTGED